MQSAKTRVGADCDSDHEHLITKFRVKLKKVEVTNRFKGLDLIHRVPKELRIEVCDIVQEAAIKTIPKKKKCKKAK